MKILLTRIRQLVQTCRSLDGPLRGAAMDELPVLENAYLLIDNGVIRDYGPMEELPGTDADMVWDLSGRLVLPAWIDSHTHSVFPGSRYGEFIDKIKGLSYEEIAACGGGILQSARKLAQMSEEELYAYAMPFVRRIREYGTGVLEIKSGYGLSVEGELKMLRVIRKIGETTEIPVKSTFLGAHAVPPGMSKRDYIRLIIDEMLPQIHRENLAEFIDVFCEKDYFDARDTAEILEAGRHYGLKPKVHVNQFTSIGGVQTAVRYDAVSVDHLEVMTEADFETLANSSTVATVLPGCSFFLGIPYAPAKEMIRRGIALALATDFNPGSAPSWNMSFAVSLACIKQKLTPEQAINAATVNAAAALDLPPETGMICKGRKADLNITVPMEHYGEIPYFFATQPVQWRITGDKITPNPKNYGSGSEV